MGHIGHFLIGAGIVYALIAGALGGGSEDRGGKICPREGGRCPASCRVPCGSNN